MVKIRPIPEKIIVKRKTEGDTANDKPIEGEVIAVGDGKVSQDGTVKAIDMKPGDTVLFLKTSGTEIKIEGEEYLILKEADILGVLDF